MSKNKNEVFLIALTSILGSISGVLKIVSIETPFYRISFYDIPIIIAGFTMGPIFGGISGLIADIFKMISSGYPPSLMTLSSIMWGVIPGLYFFIRKYFKSTTSKYLIMIILIIITSATAFGINTLQLYLWFGTGGLAFLPERVVTALVKLPIQASISIPIYYLYIKKMDESPYFSFKFDGKI